MTRGEIIIVAPYAPFNKPRPALIVQSIVLDDSETVTVAPITSDLAWAPGVRVPIEPTSGNGLRKRSDIMIDQLATVPLRRIGGYAGEAEPEVMARVDAALRLFLGL